MFLFLTSPPPLIIWQSYTISAYQVIFIYYIRLFHDIIFHHHRTLYDRSKYPDVKMTRFCVFDASCQFSFWIVKQYIWFKSNLAYDKFSWYDFFYFHFFFSFSEIKKTQNHFIKWNQDDCDFNDDSFKFKIST